MKKLLISAVLIATPLFAQSNSVTLSLLQPQFSNESASTQDEQIPIELQSRTGFAIEAAHQFGRTSIGVRVARMTSPLEAEFDTTTVGAGSLTLTPISANLMVHGRRGRFEPYAGAGAAYVMTSNLHSGGLDSLGLGSVQVENDLTYVLNAGAVVAISPRFGVNFEARYMPVDVTAESDFAGNGDVKFKTLTLGAGLKWSF